MGALCMRTGLPLAAPLQLIDDASDLVEQVVYRRRSVGHGRSVA
jgi:hypothetical protein